MVDVPGLIVRVIHILCGVFWAGAAMVIAGFIEPTVRGLGPDGGKFMQRMMGPARFPVYMSGSGFATSISGLILLWMGSGPRLGDWMSSGSGRSILLGGVLGLSAMAVGLSVNAPSAKRMAKVAGAIQAKGGPPSAEQSAEIAGLQKRLRAGSRIGAVLLMLSVTAMAAAHYL